MNTTQRCRFIAELTVGFIFICKSLSAHAKKAVLHFVIYFANAL